jgi:uncharacterized protein YutE (UPF0331/DUF86 family)
MRRPMSCRTGASASRARTRELFHLLVRGHVIGSELGSRLRDMAGFRNILVHGYQDVDLRIVRTVVETRLDDLLDFVQAVRVRL